MGKKVDEGDCGHSNGSTIILVLEYVRNTNVTRRGEKNKVKLCVFDIRA